MAGEVFEQAELAHSGKDGFALDADGHRSDIDLQLTQLNRFVGRRLRLRSEDITDAGNQFARAERLGDVTIGADVEGMKAIRLLCFGRQKNDRGLTELLVLANLAAEVEA